MQWQFLRRQLLYVRMHTLDHMLVVGFDGFCYASDRRRLRERVELHLLRQRHLRLHTYNNRLLRHFNACASDLSSRDIFCVWYQMLTLKESSFQQLIVLTIR